MAIYAISISGDSPTSDSAVESIAERIKQDFPNQNHYELRKNLLLVHSDLPSDELAKKIGFAGPDEGNAPLEPRVGVVLKLDRFYAGFESPSLWEWLDNHKEQ